MKKIEFTYWPVKGSAEYLRWIAAYLGLSLTEVNPTSPEEWETLRANLAKKNPFATLPIIQTEDGTVYTEP